MKRDLNCLNKIFAECQTSKCWLLTVQLFLDELDIETMSASFCLEELDKLISVFDCTKEPTYSVNSLFHTFDFHHLFNAHVFGAKLLDIRDWKQYQCSHIQSAINVNMNRLETAAIPRDEGQTLMCYGSRSVSNIETYRKLRDHCTENGLCSALQFVDIAFEFNDFRMQYPFLCVSAEQEHAMQSHCGFRSPSRRFPNVIIPNQLYLGNEWNRRNVDGLRALGITHIVDVTKGSFHGDGFQTLKIAIADATNAPIETYFVEAVDFIDGALQSPKNRVFVHCEMGVSRSSTMVMAYLVKGRGFTLYDAYKLCKEERPRIRPNEGFFDRLLHFEEVVHGESTAEQIKRDKLRQNPFRSLKSQALNQHLGDAFMTKADSQI